MAIRIGQPRSCDLTPCEFFVWGVVKSHVYANKPQTIPELKVEIRRVIGGVVTKTEKDRLLLFIGQQYISASRVAIFRVIYLRTGTQL